MPRGPRAQRERYRKFAEAYLAFGQPTYLRGMQSAIAAGYSETYAKARGYAMVDHPEVQKEFERIRRRRMRCSTIATPEEILEVLTTVVRTLPNELVDESGEILPLHRMGRDQAQAIAGVKVRERVIAGNGDEQVIERRREYRLTDRLKAAEMIAKHHGLFEADNRQREVKQTMLVMMPTGDLTLEEWTAQVAVLKAAQPRTLPEPAPRAA
jgi:phage terminase small subunit